MQDYRRRSRASRRAVQGDAIVVALTAQVLVCILLLVLAVVLKKADNTRYGEVRQDYDSMTTEGNPGGFSGLQEAFASLEKWIAGLVGGEERTPGAAPLEEPVLPEELPQEPAQPAFEFNYNYLIPAQVEAASFGQGGAFPVQLGGADPEKLPPPDGATYARVELSHPVKPPVTGLVTSEFRYREHPVSGNDDFHNGIDIAAEEGRTILAALGGEVVEVGNDNIYGNYIRIRHASNMETFYGHCSEILAAEGMQVKQGERVAKVGQTGLTTGPHLHFSVLVDGLYTDPFWILQDNIRVVE